MDSHDLIEDLTRRHVAEVRRLIRGLGGAAATNGARDALIARLASRMGALGTLANLSGRRVVFVQADRVAGDRVKRGVPTDPPKPPKSVPGGGGGKLPRVTFDEAVTALVSREPRLAEVVNGEPAYKAVQRIYRERGFSVAKATDQVVVEKVQVEIARSVQTGTPLREAREAVKKAGGGEWTDAYAENVVRTNITGAQAEGVRDQVRDPDVARVIPALRYDAVLDGDVRANHRAAHGMIAPPDHPIWERWTPPVGYQCRCTVALVNRMQLRRMGLLKADGTAKSSIPASIASGAVKPDQGFA